jgi:hypothetical protein
VLARVPNLLASAQWHPRDAQQGTVPYALSLVGRGLWRGPCLRAAPSWARRQGLHEKSSYGALTWLLIAQ